LNPQHVHIGEEPYECEEEYCEFRTVS